MDIKTKLSEIFNEDFGNARDTSIGSRKGFKSGERSKVADAQRKKQERYAEQRKKKLHKENEDSYKENGVLQHHPREFLNNSPLKLTLKESFINNLIEYVNSNNKKHLKDAIKLMEEYPNLHKFVTETSKTPFNNNVLSVYSIREHLNEEVGSVIDRAEGIKIGHLSLHEAEQKHSDREGYMILEAQISPDKILIYIPAFTKLMEELIYSGKIEEPTSNTLRAAKSHNELIMNPNVNKGVVVKIN